MSPDWASKVMPVPYAKLDNPQSLNLYAYVSNNPLVRIDLDGHVVALDPMCGTGGACPAPFQIPDEWRWRFDPYTKAGPKEWFNGAKDWFGKAKDYYDKYKTAKSVKDDSDSMAGWGRVLRTANEALSRDTDPSYKGPQGDLNVDAATIKLATAELYYLGAVQGSTVTQTANGVVSSPASPLTAIYDQVSGITESSRQQLGVAQDQYNQAISAWATSSANAPGARVEIENPQQ